MSNVQVNSQWRSVEQKFYRKDWPLTKLLEARNGGLITDEGEAWIYVFSHKDGTGGEYDLLRRRVPAPAVPDDVAGLVAELRVIGCHENGDARCTCGIGMEAADTIEAQAAELARMREALGPFAAVAEHDIGDDETDGEAFRPMQFLNRAPKLTVGDLRRARAALTHPTGEPK